MSEDPGSRRPPLPPPLPLPLPLPLPVPVPVPGPVPGDGSTGRGHSRHVAVPSARHLGRHAPVSLAIGCLTVAVSVAEVVPQARKVVSVVAYYRGTDLEHGRLWRLVPSALAAQSVPQLLWTLVMIGTVFVVVERRLGSIGLLAIVLSSHVVATLIADALAYSQGWRSWLTSPDFGTSCLIMGALTALLLITRSRLLGGALVLLLVGDGILNSPMTVVEHLLAIVTALACSAIV